MQMVKKCEFSNMASSCSCQKKEKKDQVTFLWRCNKVHNSIFCNFSDRVAFGRQLDLPVYFGDAGSREVKQV